MDVGYILEKEKRKEACCSSNLNDIYRGKTVIY